MTRNTSTTGATGRVCSKCGKWFSWETFSPQRRGLNGRRAICKPCVVVYSIEWNRKHPEARKAAKNRYYEKNKDTPAAEVRRQRKNARQIELRADPAYAEAQWSYRNSNLDARRKYEKHYQLKTKYGMTPEQYEALWRTQDCACAICRKGIVLYTTGDKAMTANVDHDHETGEVRGLLCLHCNAAIGYFSDDPTLLVRGLNYLHNPPNGRKVVRLASGW